MKDCVIIMCCLILFGCGGSSGDVESMDRILKVASDAQKIFIAGMAASLNDSDQDGRGEVVFAEQVFNPSDFTGVQDEDFVFAEFIESLGVSNISGYIEEYSIKSYAVYDSPSEFYLRNYADYRQFAGNASGNPGRRNSYEHRTLFVMANGDRQFFVYRNFLSEFDGDVDISSSASIEGAVVNGKFSDIGRVSDDPLFTPDERP